MSFQKPVLWNEPKVSNIAGQFLRIKKNKEKRSKKKNLTIQRAIYVLKKFLGVAAHAESF